MFTKASAFYYILIMRQNKYDERESKYRAWFDERDKIWEKLDENDIHVNFPSLITDVIAEFNEIDKRYGLSTNNREVWNVLWNKIFGKPANHINPKHDRQRRCKKISTRVNCDRYNEVKDIRDRLENE